MKILYALFLLLVIHSSSFGQDYNEEYGVPVVVLMEADPWLMIIGSDVPTIAIYQSGYVIYKRVEDEKINYYSVKMDTTEVKDLIKSLEISDSLVNMPKYIEATDWTDQPSINLYMNFDSLMVRSVYGDLRNDSESRNKTPECFLKVYDKLIGYKDKREVPWMPDYVEIVMADYSNSPEEPVKWPSSWPDLESKTTIMRSESLYSIYIEKEKFSDFLKIEESLQEGQGIEVNGKKFWASYRFPYPNMN